MKSAILINISDIGDIVSSSIVLDSLLEQNFKVTFILPKHAHTLLDTSILVNVFSEKELPSENFDLLIDLTSDKNSRKIVRSIKASKKIGRIKNNWQRVRHWITYNVMIPKRFDGHIVNDYYPLLQSISDKQERLPTLVGKNEWPKIFQFDDNINAVAIHFGAHNSKRIIPEYLLSHAINFLTNKGFKIILIGTEDDIANEIIKNNSNIPIYHKISLSEVKSVLIKSKLFIGSDSGILHIAAALGVNSIGVYGPNTPNRSGPRHKHVTFFEQDLECRPCNQNIECKYTVKCMNTLDKNQFLHLVKEKLHLT